MQAILARPSQPPHHNVSPTSSSNRARPLRLGFEQASPQLRLEQIENRRRALTVSRALHAVVLRRHRDARECQPNTSASDDVAMIGLRDLLRRGALALVALRSRDVAIDARPRDCELPLTRVPDRQRHRQRELRAPLLAWEKLRVIRSGNGAYGN